MRKNIGDVLFNRTQQGLLKIFFLAPDGRFYLSDLAKKMQVTPSSLQRALSDFHEAGLIESEKEGRQIYYRVNRKLPVYDELRSLVVKTFGGLELIRERLEELAPKIALAFIYGSVAKGEEKPESDIDLMLIGTVSLSEAVKALRGLEKQLGREINPTVYTLPELKRKKTTSFIKTVLASEKLDVMGNLHELDEIIG